MKKGQTLNGVSSLVQWKIYINEITTYIIAKRGTLRPNFVECLAIFSNLCFHICQHAGLEFHGKFILVDGDLFNHPPDQLRVIFGNGGGCSCRIGDFQVFNDSRLMLNDLSNVKRFLFLGGVHCIILLYLSHIKIGSAKMLTLFYCATNTTGYARGSKRLLAMSRKN